MTNVPPPVFAATGLSVPDESDIKAGFWADFQEAFGGALNPSDATPQGQMVAALTAVLGANNDLFLKYVSQVDPAFADGRMQEAIARIYYLARRDALATVVACTCIGASGTTIPAGSLAQGSDGTLYQCLSEITIPSTGSIDATFQAVITGPIACPAGSLTTIYRVVPGWDAITNPSDGVVGRNAETRAEFEARRAASVAGNAAGILAAVRGAVLGVDNVVDAFVTENDTASTISIGTVDIDPNSVYVAVYGGTDQDVARAIWSRKPPGCAYTGDTTVTITDTSSGYSIPYPVYEVTFKRATALPIFIKVTFANNGLVPSDVLSQTQNAVIAAFNGMDGGPAARIGGTLYALRFAAAAQGLGSWAQLISITIGTSAAPTGSEVDVPIDAMPTIAASAITVALA